ncbi:hypothetical protein V0288_19110 [Pannus brasiliensis CCIBt3594]|uniref:LAGLIDADG homing endonuclease n=1 Tax=Pannus brasiliensis CCIBt3594 TaxID=1427578 RepID=A0AAW9QQ97_9CHRO
MEKKASLLEILAKIKQRPGLYIGRPSVSDLFMFLVGYKTARRELGIEPTAEEIQFHQEFHPFVENKYNVKTSNSWAKIIMLYCSDEKHGFDQFFQLLEEFQQKKERRKPAERIEEFDLDKLEESFLERSEFI